MARDRDDEGFSKRRREREQAEEESQKAINELAQRQDAKSSGNAVIDASEHYMELIRIADMAVDQVNNLYQMFAVGVERLPPHEREKVLDKMIFNLQSAPKPTPSSKFRFSTLLSRYQTFKDKWSRMMKDIESGKIKRVAGPKRH